MIKKTGSVCVAMGILFMTAGLCLLIWNCREDYLAGEGAETALVFVKDAIEQQAGRVDDTGQYRRQGNDKEDAQQLSCEINGCEYIGYVSVPALQLELPVMAVWDYSRLKLAPCRYYGSAADNNLVIAAHNYSTHFGKLSKLSEGDEVRFTDMEGIVWRYRVGATDVLTSEAVEEMIGGDYDLTLFTCTYGGASRVTVRCMRNDEH